MANLHNIQNVYFIGIGGIGMSAIARYFNEQKVKVQGYDKTATELTQKLQQEGIAIHFEDDINQLDKNAQLVVYTPAIPAEHKELNWYSDHNYEVVKRSDVLQWITQALYSITVAGTHGKTTVSTMIATLLRETQYGCNAFLGGISVNYESNYWGSENPTAVIEADEYDRSFLKLHPDVAVLTSMDPDHLDIYGTVEEMEKAFIQYTQNIKAGGTLIVKHGLKRSSEFKADNIITYSLQNNAADAYAANILQKNGGYEFDYISKTEMIANIVLNVGGMHNVENAVAAITVALTLKIDAHQIKQAVAKFKGVKRRFEYIVKNDKTVYIDDYAHHPEELAALINSAKKLFPDRKCVVAFQPHLFSRTRDLAEGFAHSLDRADEVLLLPIYPARELPIEGVTSQMIAAKMENKACTILSKEALLEYVKVAPVALFITSGAGDIDKLVKPIKEILENK
jgi:UDP-N-acetylmuramate--alanine ligase